MQRMGDSGKMEDPPPTSSSSWAPRQDLPGTQLNLKMTWSPAEHSSKDKDMEGATCRGCHACGPGPSGSLAGSPAQPTAPAGLLQSDSAATPCDQPGAGSAFSQSMAGLRSREPRTWSPAAHKARPQGCSQPTRGPHGTPWEFQLWGVTLLSITNAYYVTRSLLSRQGEAARVPNARKHSHTKWDRGLCSKQGDRAKSQKKS